MTRMHHVNAFGIVGQVAKNVFRGGMTNSMSEIAEAVDGEMYANALLDQDETDSVVGETDKLLVSALPSLDQNFSSSLIDVEFNLSEVVSPSSPPLTFPKFLTMQSKRVPVAIRYSADSGMKPYFLTVAKKLKEAHPDVILDRVILPKVEVGDGKPEVAPTFEVMVDGKVVIPTVGRKDRDGLGGTIIFVSMQELDVAISRARRRRRPTTVYGEEEANVRLEILKAKAAAAASSSHPSKRKMAKPSKD
eukprot:CAMPEP_0170219276 /NCGR_PEP_ID=MMETSP0116_2-20130129/9318_1 /TAXON_ID=400756 /ORGANISM="Durinskia baltica, Strain CSIRO CS-38" /LENGTH=247 /DNA_ID=CAMNT_0010469939 /DNA_START=298 /DNA_END=1041 /DNA_ORIENTATION=-